MRYKAFISYSHRDEAIAKRLHRRLERFRPPAGLTLPDGARPERLYPIFRDRDEMGASHSLPNTIQAALEASDHLIVLCSPASAASNWVDQEIKLFVDAKGADRVLPVIVAGDPPDCFPEALRHALEEPLAPDSREGKDGYTDGVLKIIAGLWGASLGALKDREGARLRRIARLNAALAAVFAALVVFAGFSGWRALEQAERAEAEAQVAEARSLAAIARFTFDRNPGETSVAAMMAAQSLRQSPTPEAHDLLRDALALAPLGATQAPFPWLRPVVETSRNGRVAGFMSVYSSDDAPAKSTIVRLSPELEERERISFEGLAEPVFSPDGAWMAAAGRLRRLFVQNLSTGETALDHPTKSGFAASFSSDGATLYAATQLGEVLRWSAGMEGPESIASTPGGGARLTLPELSLAPSDDVLLRTERGQPGAIIALKDGAVKQVPFSPTYEKINWREHEPSGAVAHPTEAKFISYDSFNVGALRDLTTMKPLWSFDDQSRSWSRSTANIVSRDGAYYARGRGDGVMTVRSMIDGAILHRSDHNGAVVAMTFLDQPTHFAAAGEGGASIWMIGEEAPLTRCAPDAHVLSMALEATDALLLGARDGRLIRCDPRTGAALSERSYGAPVTSIATAPGQIAIALKESDAADNWTEMSFLDRTTGTSTQLSLNGSFDQLKLSETGAFAVTRSWPTREVSIWNTSSGALVNRFVARGDIVGLSPDGGRLLMDYLALDVFDVASGKRLVQMGEAAGVSGMFTTASEGMLITNGQIDGEQEHWLWNVETGGQLWRSPGDVIMAPDGDAFVKHVEAENHWLVAKRETAETIGLVPFQGEQWGAVLSPGGANIAVTRRITAEDDGARFETELWDVRSNKLIWKKSAGSANTPAPRVVSLSAGRAAYVYFVRNAAGSIESGIDIFDWATGAVVFSAQWPGFGVPVFEVDPQAQEILIAAGGRITLYRFSDGMERWSVQEDFSRSMAFSPANDIIAVSQLNQDGQNTVAILDRRTGAHIREWSFEPIVQDLAITPDGRLAIAAIDSDNWSGLRAWRIADGTFSFELELDASPRQIAPLRDPERLVVFDYSGSVRSFDLPAKRMLHRFPMSIRTSERAHSIDGARAITATGSRLQYWESKTGQLLDTHGADGQVTNVSMTADGAEVAFVTKRKRKARGGVETPIVKIWRPATDDPIETLAASRPERLGYSPTDDVFVIKSGSDELRIFDARTLAPRFSIKPLANGSFAPYGNDTELFTVDGRHFAVLETASYGQGNTSEKRAALRILNFATGTEIARFDVNPTARGLAPTQSGFFYTDMTGRARHFEIGARPLDRVLADEQHEQIDAVHRSELILVSGYYSGSALIDIRTGARVELAAKDDTQYILDSAVDPSGRFVGLSRVRENGEAGAVSEVLIFDAKSGELLSRTQRPQMRLKHIEFAEDGETLVASEYAQNSLITNSTDDGGLYKWRWRDRQFTPIVQDNPVADFTISADGAWLVTSEGGKNRDTDEQYGRMQTRLIRIADGAVYATRPHDIYGPDLAISSDGKRLGVFSASSPTAGDVVQVDGSGGMETLLDVSLNDAAIFGEPLGFIEKGAKFVLGERSGARVYNLDTEDVHRIRVPGRAKRYALSGDGALIAIGGDSFVSIWDLRSREQVTSFDMDGLYRLAFAGEKMRSLIAITNSKVVRLEWDQETLISTACRAFRNDAWASGKKRLAAIDAPEVCAD